MQSRADNKCRRHNKITTRTWYRHSTKLSDSRTHVDCVLKGSERSATQQARYDTTPPSCSKLNDLRVWCTISQKVITCGGLGGP